jgi:hypothetical protein
MATALAIVAFSVMHSAAMAQSYSGNYPLTVTQSHHADGTYCLTLTDDGSLGRPHSGEASLTGEKVGGTLPYGTFQVIDQFLVVTIDQPAGTGVDDSLVFTVPARNGNIVGKGVYVQVYGEAIDSGVVAFGVRGGC